MVRVEKNKVIERAKYSNEFIYCENKYKSTNK